MRLFVALTLPDAIQDEVQKAQTELRRALPQQGVRWTKREQFHLTLKFLGDVDAARVEELKAALLRACQGGCALKLRVEGIGFFPNARAPRVIWTGVAEAGGGLARLQAMVAAATAGFTVEKSGEKFAGHVTLGRVRDLRRPAVETLAQLAVGMAGRNFGQWEAGEVELIQSELTPEGSRYSTLAVFALPRGRG